MEKAVFISICIPAYKNVSFLRRLLDSIQIQSYRHFEVVVTDDSPDNEVFELCSSHTLKDSLRYFKNDKNLGTPENWNESLRRARGEWIKLMHDDDWFAVPEALMLFANAIRKHPEATFFFSAYANVYLERNSSEEVHISGKWQKYLEKDPKSLISSNRIGPPRVTIHRFRPGIFYDPTLKWLVDIDFYIRFLENNKAVFVPESLVKVGLGNEQVTQQVFRNPSVEIPENLYLLNKIGERSLKNIIVYDAYWRFIRNMNLRSVAEIRIAGYVKPVPAIISSMIRFQSFIPKAILKTGIFSKSFMFLHYLFNYSKLTRG
jgi:glycosyltransferase involved in cell wall biosynthesis